MRKDYLYIVFVLIFFVLFGCSDSKLSGKDALAEGDGDSTEQIIDLIVSDIKSGEYSIAKDTYTNLIDEFDKDTSERSNNEISALIKQYIADEFHDIIPRLNVMDADEKKGLSELIAGIQDIGIKDDDLTKQLNGFETTLMAAKTNYTADDSIDGIYIEKVNFNLTGVDFVRRFKTSERFLFEKERIFKNVADNFSIYNVILRDEMDLSVKYSKAGEIIDVVTLESEILDPSDADYSNWMGNFLFAAGHVIMSLNPNIPSDDVTDFVIGKLRLAEDSTYSERKNIDYVFEGVSYSLYFEDSAIYFRAQDQK